MLSDVNRGAVTDALRKYWGFETLRPLQADAIEAGLARRDSLVVMPTGGGKSLCFQVPPLIANRTDVVISPLIALMKDQVDGLRANGYPAAAIHSGLRDDERAEIYNDIQSGKLRLIFVSPEKLLTSGFIRLLHNLRIRSFAVDEAHCVSHWGHDFRPEYRRIAELKQHFPDAAVHAFTATATERVRQDIIGQLKLNVPAVLVGNFDRPNLVYRVIPRKDRLEQITQVLRRHRKQAVIIYCISRRDTENVCAQLTASGFNASYYHAGLSPEARRKTQDDFARERVDIIVATVAFGMGIDRSDVRCVIHAGMPKSVEHYQQEAGRAGRDGLEAECVLLYSAADVMKWEDLVTKSAVEANVSPAILRSMLELLNHMRAYAVGVTCRHASLVNYFGQPFTRENCGACDVCLGEIPDVEDTTVLAQKVLSCVARVGERFGVGYLVDVLRGSETDRVRQFGHEQLSTFGLLSGMDKQSIQRRVHDLLDQGLLDRQTIEASGMSLPVITLNKQSWQIMRGERRVSLRKLDAPELAASAAGTTGHDDSWRGVDRELFEQLRALRQQIATERDVPAYVVFGDATLRDLARKRPDHPSRLPSVHGIGAAKAAEFGARVIDLIRAHCAATGVAMNIEVPVAKRRAGMSARKRRAFEMFRQNAGVEAVIEETRLASSTIHQYLADFIEETRPAEVDHWIDAKTLERLRPVFERHGTYRLRPAFDALDGAVSFETLRLAAAVFNCESDLSPVESAPPDASL